MGNLDKAMMLLEQRRYEEATIWIQRSLEDIPDDGLALALLALCQMNLGDLDEALATAKSAMAAAPDDGHSYYAYGCVCVTRNEAGLAGGAVDHAIALDPENATYLGLRGLIHLHQRQFRKAALRLHQARSLAPDSPDIATQLGSLLLRQGKLGEAEALVRSVLPQAPVHDELLCVAGEVALGRGAPEEATGHFSAALAANPGSAEARSGLHRCRRGGLPGFDWIQAQVEMRDPMMARGLPAAMTGMGLLCAYLLLRSWSALQWEATFLISLPTLFCLLYGVNQLIRFFLKNPVSSEASVPPETLISLRQKILRGSVIPGLIWVTANLGIWVTFGADSRFLLPGLATLGFIAWTSIRRHDSWDALGIRRYWLIGLLSHMTLWAVVSTAAWWIPDTGIRVVLFIILGGASWALVANRLEQHENTSE